LHYTNGDVTIQYINIPTCLLYQKSAGGSNGAERPKIMGSTTKNPKKNDIAIVRIRQKPSREGGSGGQSPTEGQYCPMAVSVLLPKSTVLRGALTVHLRATTDGAAVYFGGERVVDLSDAKGERIKKCLELGFRYTGRVESVKGRYYAKFDRST
jgi:hypothetical protein